MLRRFRRREPFQYTYRYLLFSVDRSCAADDKYVLPALSAFTPALAIFHRHDAARRDSASSSTLPKRKMLRAVDYLPPQHASRRRLLQSNDDEVKRAGSEVASAYRDSESAMKRHRRLAVV